MPMSPFVLDWLDGVPHLSFEGCWPKLAQTEATATKNARFSSAADHACELRKGLENLQKTKHMRSWIICHCENGSLVGKGIGYGR